MHYHKFPRWPPKGQKRGTVVQTLNHNISETIWDRGLKFGTFIYPHSMCICSKFHWNLKRWVSGMSYFDREFTMCTLMFLPIIQIECNTFCCSHADIFKHNLRCCTYQQQSQIPKRSHQKCSIQKNCFEKFCNIKM